MRAFTFSAVVVGAAAALAGCYSAQEGLSDDFGLAVRQNIAAQIADPDAVYARTEEPASSGQRAADAADRYNRGQVTTPAAQSTSSVAGAAAPAAGGGGAAGGQ
jgi:type IV pilus biogenesis protein CpaD/CtpE